MIRFSLLRSASRSGPSGRLPALLLAAASLLLAGCAAGAGEPAGDAARPAEDRAQGTTLGGRGGPPAVSGAVPSAARSTVPSRTPEEVPSPLPGLGPETSAAVPSWAGQAVVVTGRHKDSNESTLVLYERSGSGWLPGPSRPARNALNGWTDHHLAGDLRSPVGVYTLTDAGGLRPDPGSLLPYHHSDAFTPYGTGFEGESLDGAFDYVIAIDYNREPGTTPLDWARPLGEDRGGGIWLHVDHGGPTHGCVSLAEKDMKYLLRSLDPRRHPVVVMGDAEGLRR
ncbi:L,D-transpeptidase family protein [Streptomyces sp. NPDC008313]|uniref:L,D-transpeptidase family protein n=1 Tax=Streptomyces sp. NPDC008313 TaxID=3364826 RepID=UPI0036EF0536